jgi:hypothetical protein
MPDLFEEGFCLGVGFQGRTHFIDLLSFENLLMWLLYIRRGLETMAKCGLRVRIAAGFPQMKEIIPLTS